MAGGMVARGCVPVWPAAAIGYGKNAWLALTSPNTLPTVNQVNSNVQ